MGDTVALLTGRGGSSFSGKNVRKILGIECLKYPAIAAKNTEMFDWMFCSSDDDTILALAEEVGFSKIERPAELATETAIHMDVIEHALSVMETRGIDVDYLVVLLANNVCVTSDMLKKSMALIESSSELTSVVPVYREYDLHPLRAMKLSPHKRLLPFVDKKSGSRLSSNRQDLEPAFFLCHNFWLISVKNQRDGWTGEYPWPFLGNNILPVEIEKTHDIHNEEDIHTSQKWLIENNILYSHNLEINLEAGEYKEYNKDILCSSVAQIEAIEAKLLSTRGTLPKNAMINSNFFKLKKKLPLANIKLSLKRRISAFLPAKVKVKIKSFLSGQEK